MDLARRRQLKVVERAIMPEELAKTDEVFLVGTAAEVTPVGQVGDHKFKVGPITRQLRERGENVTVAVRRTSNTAELQKLGVATVIADALDPAQVQSAVTSGNFAAVISTLGTTRGEQDKRPDFIGNRNVIDASKAAGIKRFVFITVVGTGNSAEAAPRPSRNFLKDVIALKSQAEDHLRASGLDYTIIRPGGLGDVPATGTAVLVDDPAAFSYIGRIDLANLAVQALGDPATIGKTYTAWDPSRKTMAKMFY